MSSTKFNDQSCSEFANRLSCAAMVELAKREAGNNATLQRYQVDGYPAPERFCEMMDRMTETALQKAGNTGKRLCITKKANYQEGPWADAFRPLVPPGPTLENVRYAIHTKAKAPTSM